MFGGNGRGARRVSAAMLGITAGLFAHASSASASTLTASFVSYNCCLPTPIAGYSYTAGAGERNNVTIRFNTGLALPYLTGALVQVDVFGDSGALISGPVGPINDPGEFGAVLPGILCLSPSPLVLCNSRGYWTIVGATLGDGNDRAKVDDGGRRYQYPQIVRWDGGPGDDVTGGGTARTNAVTEDSLAGPGADTVLSGRADYVARTTAQSLTLDGVGNDGDPGENDNLSPKLTDVFDGSGNSILIGSDAAQNLYGGDGADQIDPKKGADTVSGWTGDDTITLAPDGAKDTVACGAGSDTVTRVGGVDPLDVIAADCENLV